MPIALVTSLSTVSHMMLAFPGIGSRSTVTSGELYYYLESAAFEVLGKLAPLYTVPATQSGNALHAQLTNLTTQLALQMFFEQRAYMQQSTNENEWPEHFEKARDLLDQIASGAIPLVNNDGSIVARATGEHEVWSDKSGYPTTMTEGPVEEQVDDPIKLYDADQERLNRWP